MKTIIFPFLFIFSFSIAKVMGQTDPCNPPCSLTIDFLIGENLFSSINDPNQHYAIDFGDGHGVYTNLPYHLTISIQYPSAGTYTIKHFYQTNNPLDDGKEYLQYAVACVPPPDNSYPLISTIPYCPPSYVECFPIDNECDTTGHTYTFDDTTDTDCEAALPDSCVTVYPPCITASGQVSILYGCGNTTGKLG